MNITKTILNAAVMMCLALSIQACNDLEGDNSDFNFDGKAERENPARLENSVRLATYNVHRCAPPNSNTANYEATAKAIGLLDVDVVALQELDKNTNSHPEDQLQQLANRTGLKPYFCKTIDSNGGEYGIGILSKSEPVKTDSGDLPGVEKRKFFVVEFADYIFIATHFCHQSDDNRKWSFDIINEYIAENLADYKKPIFLAGDLNTSSLPSNALTDWEVISTSSQTFPSGYKRIDYIMAYKGNSPVYKVLRTFVPKFDEIDLYEVSDHLPVLVDLNKF